MATLSPSRYVLDANGHRYEVDTRSSGLSTFGRLSVDGVPVAEQKSKDGSIHLEGAGLLVVVRLSWMNQLRQILAVPSRTDPKTVEEGGIAFAPPAGSRAAKLEKMKRVHPNIYAARHIAIAMLQVLFGVLGIGALLRGLLPRIDVPDVPWPDLPAIPWPVLPAIPWPNVPLPGIDVPHLPFLDQLQNLWSAVNWLVPIVIAVVIALNEVNKRRKMTISSWPIADSR